MIHINNSLLIIISTHSNSFIQLTFLILTANEGGSECPLENMLGIQGVTNNKKFNQAACYQ